MNERTTQSSRAKSRCGRPGLLIPNSPYGLCGRKATLNLNVSRAQELCERRGGRPGLSVLNSSYGLCKRKATLNLNVSRAQELGQSRGGRPGLSVPNSPSVLCGLKASIDGTERGRHLKRYSQQFCSISAVNGILPPTTAVIVYATGLEKLPAKGQFFVGAQIAVSL